MFITFVPKSFSRSGLSAPHVVMHDELLGYLERLQVLGYGGGTLLGRIDPYGETVFGVDELAQIKSYLAELHRVLTVLFNQEVLPLELEPPETMGLESDFEVCGRPGVAQAIKNLEGLFTLAMEESSPIIAIGD